MPRCDQSKLGFPCADAQRVDSLLKNELSFSEVTSTKFLYSCQDQNVKVVGRRGNETAEPASSTFLLKLLNVHLYQKDFGQEILVHDCLDKFLSFCSDQVTVQTTIAQWEKWLKI